MRPEPEPDPTPEAGLDPDASLHKGKGSRTRSPQCCDLCPVRQPRRQHPAAPRPPSAAAASEVVNISIKQGSRHCLTSSASKMERLSRKGTGEIAEDSGEAIYLAIVGAWTFAPGACITPIEVRRHRHMPTSRGFLVLAPVAESWARRQMAPLATPSFRPSGRLLTTRRLTTVPTGNSWSLNSWAPALTTLVLLRHNTAPFQVCASS